MKDRKVIARDIQDIEANTFAMELLMPENWVREYLREHPDFDVMEEIHVGLMAAKFQVPMQLVVIRLTDMNLIIE